MNLLAVDTTEARCGVLVRAAGRDLVLEETIARGHDARLAPMAAEALKSAGLAPKDLDRIVVAAGPGSFTGVRVGVAFARGLALALRAPAVGVSGLDALARTAAESGLLVAAHDAKRGEVVWRAYRDGAPIGDAQRSPVEDAIAGVDAARGDAPATLAGTGAPLLAGEGRRDTGVARFTLAALADLGAAAEPSAAPPEPFYHRPPDAELPEPARSS